jgi:uncharacterized protein with PIN domain/sulfur carrier protein ThiS
VATATFRFYAELNDLVAPERRFRDSAVRFEGPLQLKDAVEALGVPHGEVDLVLVNGRSVPFSERLRDGDRVAVYPVLEAFDVAGLSQVRQEPLREPRFVLDGHLGRLAAYLRLLGFDALWEQQPRDEDLARVSAAEHRVLLTRDLGLLKRKPVTHGLWVRSLRPREQLREVVQRLHLERGARPFSRCLRCNGALETVEKRAVLDALPPVTRERVDEFWRCAGCAQVYWAGAHHARQRALIAEALGPGPSP